MAEQVSDRIRIDAPPQRCYEVAIDYERYPEWAKDIKQATVLERDDHLFCAIDHVVGGENVALFIEDHAGAEATARPLSPRGPIGPRCRAHVHRASPRPFHRLNVRVLQVRQHGHLQNLGGV